jgi:acetyl esterase/lipase
MLRPQFLAAMTTLVLAHAVALADDKPTKQTFTYKTVGDLPIQVDVYGASNQSRPVVLWLHGGALIVGDRTGIDQKLVAALLKAGYVVVSADYRLAPETKLPAILDDVRDVARWIRTDGPSKFGADPKRLAVMGGSAGGYLTLTTGYRVEPRPLALVAFWGYGDLVGPWYSRPDPFYRTKPLVPKEEAVAAVGTKPLTGDTGKARGRFYLYCRQNGLWPKEIAGLDPIKDADAFTPFCPVQNVADDYPPTLLIHGTKDTDVPYELSASMAQELKRKGVAHELLTFEGAGHGLSGAKPGEYDSALRQAVAFVSARLGR